MRLNGGVPVANPRANNSAGSSGSSSSLGALTDAEYLAYANQWGLSTASDSPYKDIIDTLRGVGGFTSVTDVPINGGTLSYNQKTGASSFSVSGVTVSGVLDTPVMQNKSTNEMLGNLRSVTIALDPQVLMLIRYSEAYASLNHKSLHQLKEWDQDFYEGVRAIQSQYGLQVRLEALGYVPVVGDVADIINGAIYLMQGDAGNAKFYFIAAVPFAGDGAKLVRKLATSEVANVVKAAGKLPQLINGMKVAENQVLDLAENFLGQGYKEVAPGVFRSGDGLRQVRMTNSDLAPVNNHAGAAHLNFETGTLTTKPNGKVSFDVTDNIHVFIEK